MGVLVTHLHPHGPIARSFRRRRQRGATVFIVTMVMALLTGMGIFASRAAGLTELAAGFDRSSEQTHYVLEHGVLVALHDVGRSPQATIQLAKEQCYGGLFFPSIAGYTYTCKKYLQSSLERSVSEAQANAAVKVPIFSPAVVPGTTTPSTTDPTANRPGSLGPVALNTALAVELTDLNNVQRPVAGSSVGSSGPSLKYVNATMGAWGQVSPYLADTGTCGVAGGQNAISASREVGRAYVIIGPL
jgi:hypothetical protein